MKPKVLLIGTYDHPPYHPLKGGDQCLTDLLSDLYDVQVTDRSEDFLALHDERALVISYVDEWNLAIPDEHAAALRQYVENGGGLLAIHNGISLQMHPLLEQLLGGKFTRHPAQEAITYHADPEGFLAACPDFTLTEEPYQFEMNAEVTPILHYTYHGDSYLAGWERTQGEGRVVFLSPGHTLVTFEEPSFRDMIRMSALRCQRQNKVMTKA